jgi:hypothetical protein
MEEGEARKWLLHMGKMKAEIEAESGMEFVSVVDVQAEILQQVATGVFAVEEVRLKLHFQIKI